MKKTLTIISFAFIAVGCSEKELPADKPVPQINEQADKLPEEPTAKSLTGEEAFEILRTGLSGITFDKKTKPLRLF